MIDTSAQERSSTPPVSLEATEAPSAESGGGPGTAFSAAGPFPPVAASGGAAAVPSASDLAFGDAAQAPVMNAAMVAVPAAAAVGPDATTKSRVEALGDSAARGGYQATSVAAEGGHGGFAATSTRTFTPTTTQSPRSIAHDEDEDEPRHAQNQATQKRVAQAPTNPATLAHQTSDAESVMAALSALELYASTIDDNAKYIVSGSASTSPGPLENTLLDNVNSVRDLTDHISGYVRGLGIPPATLQRRRPATLARVDSALAHAEAADRKSTRLNSSHT